MSLLRISRDRNGMLEVSGRSWQADGMLSARYWSEAAREKKDPQGVFYYWKGERPRHPNAPAVDGTGEIRLESADRAAGYLTTSRTSSERQHQDIGGLPARRSRGPDDHGRKRRSETRRVDRGTVCGVGNRSGTREDSRALEPRGVGATTNLGEGPVADEVSVLPDRHHRVVKPRRLDDIGQGLGFGRHRHGLEGAEFSVP